MSLRVKIVALVLGLTLAILGGLWLHLSGSWAGWSIEALDRDLHERADTLAELVELEDGALELDREHDVPALRDPTRPYRILGPAGVVARSGDLEWPPVDLGSAGGRTDEVKDAGGRVWRVASTRFAVDDDHHGRRRGTAWFAVQVGGEAAPHRALEERFRRGLLVALAAALLAGGIGAAALAHFALAPMRRVAAEVDAIGAISLERRVGTSGLDRELERVATAFNGLLARLEDAMARQRQLVSRASHALRTPVATILTRSEVALRRERDPAAYRSALEDVAAAARECSILVGHLLTLSRLDERRGTAVREEVPVAQVTGDIMRLLSSRAEDAGVSMELDVPDRLLAHAERAALRELLEALLDNAILYTPRGGRAGVRANETFGGCALTVWDTGPGIPPAERVKVFERFYRGEGAQASARMGSGLGLAIVKAIADGHGGTVTLGDRAGGGLEVTVTFPARAPGSGR